MLVHAPGWPAPAPAPLAPRAPAGAPGVAFPVKRFGGPHRLRAPARAGRGGARRLVGRRTHAGRKGGAASAAQGRQRGRRARGGGHLRTSKRKGPARDPRAGARRGCPGGRAGRRRCVRNQGGGGRRKRRALRGLRLAGMVQGACPRLAGGPAAPGAHAGACAPRRRRGRGVGRVRARGVPGRREMGAGPPMGVRSVRNAAAAASGAPARRSGACAGPPSARGGATNAGQT
ncbi:MAG: hypothetical protein J3K34DRAFT_398672 [Monoraphidium minutum]|nr:MAG: hypothetical protein J3K34DRAFT_398672 [Monoraphidium minutum]